MLYPFKSLGAELVVMEDELSAKFSMIKAFVSDWDGVFNDGIKNPGNPSPYAEADSMGLNLLRYSFWLKKGKIPPFAIITGAENPTAIELAKREHFQVVYSKIVDKKEALLHFCKIMNLHPSEVACFFDDANDLSMAKACGLRFLFRRNASPLFHRFVKEQQICDYVTANEGKNYAIREVSEVMMLLNNNYEQVLQSRADFDEKYQQYYQLRQSLSASFFRKEGEGFKEVTV